MDSEKGKEPEKKDLIGKGFTFEKMSQPAHTISITNLKVSFKNNICFEAVKGISFNLSGGETLALVGQSGSGKSVTSLALMGLLPSNAIVSGEMLLNGEIHQLDMPQQLWECLRGKNITMIFQEPMSALNPVKTCGYQLIECIRSHHPMSRKDARAKALEWFYKVKLPNPEQLLKRYPHQLSGGQKQRVMIAMAMCNHPDLLIADEPTTALDVTVQKEIVTLMKDLQKEYGMAILFITHDRPLAATIADRYITMEDGKIIDNDVNFLPNKFSTQFATLSTNNPPLLHVENVRIFYPNEKNWLGKISGYDKAVDGVSFDLFDGEILGLVGESGCGKSTLSRSLLGLQPINSGSVFFNNKEITKYDAAQWRHLRKDIQIIFQDPFSALNQRMKVGDALAEPIHIHGLSKGHDVRKQVEELLKMVGLPSAAANKYPHEFSGGQRQRICIARALAVEPKLVICDESVSALDAKIQKQILDLLIELQHEKNLTYLFITHDLTVVHRISNRVLVMQKGKIVEQGSTIQVMTNPKEDYTRKLLQAVPGL